MLGMREGGWQRLLKVSEGEKEEQDEYVVCFGK